MYTCLTEVTYLPKEVCVEPWQNENNYSNNKAEYTCDRVWYFCLHEMKETALLLQNIQQFNSLVAKYPGFCYQLEKRRWKALRPIFLFFSTMTRRPFKNSINSEEDTTGGTIGSKSSSLCNGHVPPRHSPNDDLKVSPIVHYQVAFVV